LSFIHRRIFTVDVKSHAGNPGVSAFYEVGRMKHRHFAKCVRSNRYTRLVAVGGLLLIVELLAGLLCLMRVQMAYADTSLVVTTLSDGDHGSCSLAACTLRDAINAANAIGAGPATITFNTAGSAVGISGTITLTSTLPTINNDIAIDGTGHAITISGDNAVQVMTVVVSGTLHLQSITIAKSVSYGGSGGIYNAGTLTVTNSTFAGNISSGFGGGISNFGTLTVTNGAFAGNSAGIGGGISSNGSLSMINSIIANNSGGDCVWFYNYTATGNHNLVKAEGTNACGFSNGVDGNIIGFDPLLGPLALNGNGGSTLTFLPLPGSPAINSGDNASCPAYDQRGVKRPQGGICDIGSVESLIWPRVRLLQVMR
jgi:CSLREA domain-containing protein